MTIINAGTMLPVLDGSHAGQVFVVERNVMRGNTIEAIDNSGHRHLIEPEDGWNMISRPLDLAPEKTLYRLACLSELPFPEHFFLYLKRKNGKPIDLRTVELSPDGKVILRGTPEFKAEPVDAEFEVVEPTPKLAAPKAAPKPPSAPVMDEDEAMHKPARKPASAPKKKPLFGKSRR